MQAQRTNSIDVAAGRSRRRRQGSVLLVSSEDVFSSGAAHGLFHADQFRIAGRSTTLLDALSRLDSEPVDVVLLSCEFREEELSLFAFDARRRGFAGVILHLALLPIENAGTPRAGSRGLTEGRLGQQEHDTSGTTAAVDGPLALASLTGREQAVLKRVSEGWSNQQIALHLNCSVGSVKATIQQLFRKLGVRKRAQIVRLAFEKALIHQ